MGAGLLAFALTALGAVDETNLPAFIRSNYIKRDYMAPMRDGVQLFTSVYSPRDTNRMHPIVMKRTPYSVAPYGTNEFPASIGPSEEFARAGYIAAYQDVRGRYRSMGTFLDMAPHKAKLAGPTDTDESTDAADSINWLVKNIPGNNGRVGLWGTSYPGFYAAHGMINASPALRAASPQAPMGDEGNGDDSYHFGGFYLAANFGFYNGFFPRGAKPESDGGKHPQIKIETPDSYEFFLRMGTLAEADDHYFKHRNPFWEDVVNHPNYAPYWSERALGPVMSNLTAPVLIVGGWFDAEDLGGTFKLFQAIREHGGAPAATLVAGPWSHGQWDKPGGDRLGNLGFGSKTADYFHAMIEYPFFKQPLESKNGAPAHLPVAWLFETGKNEWRKFDSWPPRKAARRSLYLRAGGKLSFGPPGDAEAFDEYVSDPAKPVPVTEEIGNGMPGDYMTRDQRFASRRTDVLVYESEPLKRDLVVAGPVTPVLRVSTSGTDSDFIVKLIDVYPDDTPDPAWIPKGTRFAGYQQMVRGEPFRGKFRNSLSAPEPFVPGQPAKIEFAMPDVLHDFRKGHRIMVQIQSSWFPMVDLNPQEFENIPTAKASDFKKAVERVYCGGAEGTRIEVLTLE